MASKRRSTCSRPGLLKSDGEDVDDLSRSGLEAGSDMASACGSEPQQTVSDFVLNDSESEGEGSGCDDCEESSASDGCSAADSDGCIITDEIVTADVPIETSSSHDNTTLDDLGRIIKPGMSTDEIDHSVLSLAPGEKYKLLTEHFVPSSSLCFSKSFRLWL